MIPSMVVVVVPIGVVRGEHVDMSVSITNVTTTTKVTAERTDCRRNNGIRSSPQPESYSSIVRA